MPTLQDIVDGVLDAAVFENEYRGLMFQSPNEVATDMRTYCREFDEFPVEDVELCLAVCVADYQKWYHEATNV
jgi:hypothetical protein